MALPPTNPPGLVRDAEDLNKVVNDEGTVNRAGESLPSLKAILGVVEARRDSAVLAIDSAQSQTESASASAIQSIQQAEADTQGALDDAVDRIITEGEQAAASTGWFVIGDFADGFEFTARNQVGRDSAGELWSYDASLPFTVPAGTTPSEPDYTNRGDAALRSALAAEGGASLVRGTVFTVDSLIGLINAPQREGQQASTSSFYPGYQKGGDLFEWDPSRPKTDHRIGFVYDPDIIAEWITIAGSTQYQDLRGAYETLKTSGTSGFGCWVKISNTAMELYKFGCLSDGVADDNAPYREALKNCLATNSVAVIPCGTTLIRATDTTLLFESDDLVNVIWGYGDKSVIKMMDGEISSRFARMHLFDCRERTGCVNIVKNCYVDNNASGSLPPENPFDYEQAHALSTVGPFKKVLYEGITGNDPAADFFNNASPNVEQYHVYDCNILNRNRVRSDVQFSSLPKEIRINNFTGTVIESEPVSSGDYDVDWQMSNINVDRMDLGTSGVGNAGFKCIIQIENLLCRDSFYVTGSSYADKSTEVYITGNSKLRTRWLGNRTALGVYKLVISDADILLYWNEAEQRVEGLHAERSGCETTNCRYEIDSEDVNIAGGTGLFDVAQQAVVADYEDAPLKVVRDCWFDPRLEISVQPHRNGRWVLDNNDYACNADGWAIDMRGQRDLVTQVELIGGNFERVMGLAFRLQSAGFYPDTKFIFKGDANGSKAGTYTFVSGTVSALKDKVRSMRRVLLSEPGDSIQQGFPGDEFVEPHPDDGYPASWVIAYDSQAAVLKTQAGMNDFTTLPAGLSAKDAGLRATLNGVPALWNGSGWIDYTGASL